MVSMETRALIFTLYKSWGIVCDFNTYPVEKHNCLLFLFMSPPFTFGSSKITVKVNGMLGFLVPVPPLDTIHTNLGFGVIGSRPKEVALRQPRFEMLCSKTILAIHQAFGQPRFYPPTGFLLIWHQWRCTFHPEVCCESCLPRWCFSEREEHLSSSVPYPLSS